jgi:hypothetical protein
MSGFRRFVNEKLVEVLIAVLFAGGGALIAQRVAIAVTTERVDSIEERINILRSENKSDHDRIISILLEKKGS